MVRVEVPAEVPAAVPVEALVEVRVEVLVEVLAEVPVEGLVEKGTMSLADQGQLELVEYFLHRSMSFHHLHSRNLHHHLV